MRLGHLVAGGCLVWLAGAVSARDFYLSPDGSGTEFTAEHPGGFAEFAQLKHKSSDEVRVILLDGVYRLGSLPRHPCERGDLGRTAIEISSFCPPVFTSVSGNPEKCILDGEAAGDGRLLTLGPNSFISGITFRNFAGAERGSVFAAVWNSVVSNCVFTGCHAVEGGAVTGGSYYNCVFRGNVAEKCGGAVYGAGRIQGCRFEDNWVMSSDCGVNTWTAVGGAVAARYPWANPTCIDCVFERSATVGSQAYRTVSPYVTLSNCTIVSEHTRIYGKRDGGPYVNSVRVKPGDSLRAARDRLRRERDPNGKAEIVFADGVYHVGTNDFLWLDRHDDFLTLRAEHPGRVRFSGAYDWQLQDFKPITSARLKARLKPTALKHVVAVRLTPEQLAAFDRPTGGDSTYLAHYGWDDRPPYDGIMSLFKGRGQSGWAGRTEVKPVFVAGGNPQPAARWPNAGSTRGNLTPRDFKFIDAGGGFVEPLNPRVAKWDHRDGLIAVVSKPADFSCHCAGLGKWDAERRAFVGKTEARYFNNSYFEQVLEELDRPGEWAIDRRDGWLCFYPRPGMTGETVCSLAHFIPPFVLAENVTELSVQDLDFVDKVGCPALMFVATERGRIERCRIVNSVASGLDVAGFGNRITDCDVLNSNGGISVIGGNALTLEHGNNLIENCLVANRTILRTSGSGISIFGCGNTLRRSTVAHVAHGAVNFGGPHQLIELNRFIDSCSLNGDAGAVYNNGGLLAVGSVVRNNDIANCGGYGVYLDDGSSGVEVSGNVIRDTAAGVFMGGGRENVITNNVILHSTGIQLDNRGLWWPSFRDLDAGQASLIRRYDVTNGAWLAQHPTIGRWYERGTNMFAHTDNVFRHNLIATSDRSGYNCNLVEIKNLRGPEAGNVSEGNVNAILAPRQPVKLETWRLGGVTLVQGSPTNVYELGFVDMPESTYAGGGYHWRRGDFRLKPDANLKRLIPGFAPIPWDKIGIYADAWRSAVDPDEDTEHLRREWKALPEFYFSPDGRGDEFSFDEPGRLKDFYRLRKLSGDAKLLFLDGFYFFESEDYENAGKYFGEHRAGWGDSAFSVAMHRNCTVEIRSVSGDPAKCIFDGRKAGKGRALAVGGVKLISGITFCNFTGAGIGGAVMGAADIPLVSNCVFEANAAVRGGAVASASVVDSVFKNNLASDCGGAAFGPAYVRNCAFIGNAALTNSAAVADNHPWADPKISGCSYTNNIAPEGKCRLLSTFCTEVK